VSTASVDRFEQHLVNAGDLLRRDEVDSARTELAAAIELRPDDLKALGLYGLACFRMNAFADALPTYKKLVELRPNDASYRLNLGLVHLKLGNAEAAIGELERSRELDPSQQRTVTYLGLAYARLGEFARAFEAFLRAGQDALAAEMEAHLTEDERAAIRGRLGREIEGEPDAGGNGLRLDETPEPVAPAATVPVEDLPDEAVEEFEAAARPNPARGSAPGRSDADAAAEADAEAELDAAVESGFGAALRAAARGETAPPEPEPEPEPEPDAAAPEPVDSGPPPGRRTQPPPPPGARDARPRPMEPEGMITRAVAMADPTGGATAVKRVGFGQSAPQPVTELATSRLIRPEDGDAAFEIGAGGVLVVRIADRIWSRTEEVVVSSGDLSFEPATRRVRGANSKEIFGTAGQQMFIITGKGYLVASPAGQCFTAVALDDDILYLRETFVYAFEEQLRWESGHVPGSNGQMHVVQFRGHGCLAVRSRKPLLSLKLGPDRVVYVESGVLGGWIGRVVPRLVAPAAGGGAAVATFVECSGEGVVLIEDQGSDPARA
jgi:tetratricopeptide (TPR) repeat protein/uncharacterized protein (AIM24 family)